MYRRGVLQNCSIHSPVKALIAAHDLASSTPGVDRPQYEFKTFLSAAVGILNMNIVIMLAIIVSISFSLNQFTNNYIFGKKRIITIETAGGDSIIIFPGDIYRDRLPLKSISS